MPLTSGTPRWQKIATFVILLTILALVWVIAKRVGTQNAAVNATRDSVERTDCARKVNAEQSAVRDRATVADRAAARYLFKALLDQPTTPDVRAQRVKEFTALVATAEKADQAVAHLPDPAKEVDRRCPG